MFRSTLSALLLFAVQPVWAGTEFGGTTIKRVSGTESGGTSIKRVSGTESGGTSIKRSAGTESGGVVTYATYDALAQWLGVIESLEECELSPCSEKEELLSMAKAMGLQERKASASEDEVHYQFSDLHHSCQLVVFRKTRLELGDVICKPRPTELEL